jgi:hypothetical protein
MVLGKRQAYVVSSFIYTQYITNATLSRTQHYSADPAMIFSGVVACATDVRPPLRCLIFKHPPVYLLLAPYNRPRNPLCGNHRPRWAMAHRPNEGRDAPLCHHYDVT